MKDLFLIPIMLAVFAVGYVLMAALERFIKKVRRPIASNRRAYRGKIRIAGENQMLLDTVAPVLERCAADYPNMTVSTDCENAALILKKVLEEKIDIALLTDRSAAQIGSCYDSIRIPCENRTIPASVLELPVDVLYREAWFHVVWKKKRKSEIRDYVIAALENEPCSVKCGYADYLD